MAVEETPIFLKIQEGSELFIRRRPAKGLILVAYGSILRLTTTLVELKVSWLIAKKEVTHLRLAKTTGVPILRVKPTWFQTTRT